MELILTVLGVFIILLASEFWWRRRSPQDEFSRKFIHILVGSQAAFWPFYLSWRQILFLAVAFVIVISISKYFHVFQAIHAVERPTLGEIYFALAVGALAIVTHQPWIYAIALLHMSLADGFAAIMGVTFGKSSRYQVFGHTKSVVGTLSFLVISAVLLSYYNFYVAPVSIGVLAALAITATAIENLGGQGLDNLLVPVVVGVVLNTV